MPRTEVPQDDVTGCFSAVAGEDVLRLVAQDAAHGQAVCAHAGAVAAIPDAHGPLRGSDRAGHGRRWQRDPWELGLQLEILLDDRTFDAGSLVDDQTAFAKSVVRGRCLGRRPQRHLRKPLPFWKRLGRGPIT